MKKNCDTPPNDKKFENGDEVVMYDCNFYVRMFGKVISVEADDEGNTIYEVDWLELECTNVYAEEGEECQIEYADDEPYKYPILEVYANYKPTGKVSGHGTYACDGDCWKKLNEESGHFKKIYGHLLKATEGCLTPVYIRCIEHARAIAAWKKANPDAKII